MHDDTLTCPTAPNLDTVGRVASQQAPTDGPGLRVASCVGLVWAGGAGEEAVGVGSRA